MNYIDRIEYCGTSKMRENCKIYTFYFCFVFVFVLLFHNTVLCVPQ
jgi:hypothetical protein